MKAARYSPDPLAEKVTRILKERDATLDEIVTATGADFAAVEAVVTDIADAWIDTPEKAEAYRRRFSKAGGFASEQQRRAFLDTRWRFAGAWSRGSKPRGRKIKNSRPA